MNRDEVAEQQKHAQSEAGSPTTQLDAVEAQEANRQKITGQCPHCGKRTQK